VPEVSHQRHPDTLAPVTRPSIRSPRTAILATAILGIAFAGCSSADGGSAPPDSVRVASDVPVSDNAEPQTTDPAVTDPAVTDPAVTDPAVTEPPTTEPAVTTDPAVTEPVTTEPSPAPRDESYLWNDVGEMVSGWDSANQLLNTLEPDSVDRLVLTADVVAVAPLQSAGDGFATTDAFTAGFLSGTIDPAGEVSALVTTIDPDDEGARSLLATSLGAVTLPWSELGVDDGGFANAVRDAYGELSALGPSIGEQRFVATPDGLPYAAVLTIIEVEPTGNPAIEVAVIPVPDEATARSVVELLRLELRAVTG